MNDSADQDVQPSSEEPVESDAESTVLPTYTFADFLEGVPPGRYAIISDVLREYVSAVAAWTLERPDLSLHCLNCQGERRFYTNRSPRVDKSGTSHIIIEYKCRNCERSPKVYALTVICHDDQAAISKMGESPSFGPPLPPRLVTLMRDDRDLLAKGLRCENQGLGVGAFAYYRRVIEQQKHRLFEQIISASRKLSAPQEALNRLQAAQKERQFEKAMREIQPAVPDALLINGQNPLTLLHDALSEGVHGLTDGECLSRATAIRTVLVALSERIGALLQEDKELTNAVNTLLKLRTGRERERKSAPPPAGT